MPKVAKNQVKIQHIIMMGDSLSDRGTLDHRKLLGILPMDALSGLRGRSPIGRFSNGYVWGDHMAARIAEEFTIAEAHHRGESSEDIADDVILHDPVAQNFEHGFTLTDDREILYYGSDFIRNYCEGGLTAASYSGDLCSNLSIFGAREIVATLEQKRDELLVDDNARGLDAAYKAQSLIIEWSGANDLITVNEIPTEQEVKRAVAARVKNIIKLHEHGYSNFILVNLPDLSLTPRFQNATGAAGQEKRKQGAHCVKLFNEMLHLECMQLEFVHANLHVKLVDVNATFQDVYNNPEKYEIKTELLKKPFISSTDFRLNPNHTSHAGGYLFWDDVHPTSYVHAILAKACYADLTRRYQFITPHESLRQKFVDAYAKNLEDDHSGFLGFFRAPHLKNYRTATLSEILANAASHDGSRALQVVQHLNWLNNKGELCSQDPVLVEAFRRIHHSAAASIKKDS